MRHPGLSKKSTKLGMEGGVSWRVVQEGSRLSAGGAGVSPEKPFFSLFARSPTASSQEA